MRIRNGGRSAAPRRRRTATSFRLRLRLDKRRRRQRIGHKKQCISLARERGFASSLLWPNRRDAAARRAASLMINVCYASMQSIWSADALRRNLSYEAEGAAPEMGRRSGNEIRTTLAELYLQVFGGKRMTAFALEMTSITLKAEE